MLKIYGADLSSPSNKVRMVANYLGLEYEYQRIKVRDGENRQEWFKKINPACKIPAIDDDGFTLFESGAICKYLCAKHKSDLYPTDLKRRAIIEQWTDFIVIHINAAVGRVVFNRLFYKLANASVDERSLQDGLNFLSRFLPVIDEQLEKNRHVAGEQLTLADISLLSALDPCELSRVDLSAYRNITRWRNALRQQPFYTKCHKEYGETLKELLVQQGTEYGA